MLAAIIPPINFYFAAAADLTNLAQCVVLCEHDRTLSHAQAHQSNWLNIIAFIHKQRHPT